MRLITTTHSLFRLVASSWDDWAVDEGGAGVDQRSIHQQNQSPDPVPDALASPVKWEYVTL